jgi:acyl dehydratase
VIHDACDRFGRYYEEFEPGDFYKHWPGRTITQADNTAFSFLTINQHPLHIDAAYTEGTQFGEKRESRKQNDRGIVTVETCAFTQRDETVLIYRSSHLGPKRDAPDAEAVRTAASAEDF